MSCDVLLVVRCYCFCKCFTIIISVIVILPRLLTQYRTSVSLSINQEFLPVRREASCRSPLGFLVAIVFYTITSRWCQNTENTLSGFCDSSRKRKYSCHQVGRFRSWVILKVLRISVRFSAILAFHTSSSESVLGRVTFGELKKQPEITKRKA